MIRIVKNNAMRIQHIRTNELSPDAFLWLQAKYSAVDAMDALQYGSFLAEDATLQFANTPAVQGRSIILAGLQRFWSGIRGLDHDFINILGTDASLAAEALIDYTRKDGRVVSLPCVTVIERNDDGLATSVRIFIDTAPIFEHSASATPEGQT